MYSILNLIRWRFTAFLVLAVAFAFLLTLPASGAVNTSVDCSARGCDALVQKDSQRPAKQVAVDPPCSWADVDVAIADAGGAVYNSDNDLIETPDGTSVDPPNPDGRPHGRWLMVACSSPEQLHRLGLSKANSALADMSDAAAYVYVTPTEAPKALAQQALSSLTFPKPVPHFSPPDMAIVNAPTWMWVDGWAPETATATAGGVSVAVTVVPVSVTWNMGDGNTAVCNGPGVAYDMNKPDAQQHSDCTYTYRKNSAGQPNTSFVVTATIQWQANWTVTGAAGGGNLGVYPKSSDPVLLQVGEIQTINVEPGGGQQ